MREKRILFGFALQKERPDGSIEILILWGRIFAVFLALLVVGWISATSVLFAILKYKQGFEAVTFTNTLLLQRSEIRKKIGDHQIEESIAQIEAGKFNNDAFRLLHLGIIRSPGNLEGRRLLAEIYERFRQRPPVAAEYLIEGLEYGGLEDVEYVKQLMRMLLRNQMDESVQEIVDTYLPEEPDLTDINRTLALGAANAHYQRGNYDQAEDYLIHYNLIESVEGLLIYSRISWERGDRIAAISKLEQMLKRFPNPEPLLIQLTSYYRETGDMNKARRFAILRSVKDPSNHKPRIELLYIHNQEGDHAREESEIERIFEQFSEDEAALLEFAGFAAKTGNTDLAKRIQTVAIENEFNVDVFTLLLLEAHIQGKDYTAFSDLSESLIEQQPEWLTKRWSIFNSLRSVAAFAMNRPDLGEVYLQNFLKDIHQRPQTYLNVANHFYIINKIPQARKVLAVAYQQFPKNQKILSELIKAELELGNTEKLNTLLTKLLQMRRPEMELLSKAYRELGSDRFIFTENRDILLMQLSTILRENSPGASFLETTL